MTVNFGVKLNVRHRPPQFNIQGGAEFARMGWRLVSRNAGCIAGTMQFDHSYYCRYPEGA